MKVRGYRPTNTWLRRQLDTRWRRWVWWCFGGATVVSVAMAAFIAPRQATLRMRYEIAQLKQATRRLEGEQRRLLLEREKLTSPRVLSGQLGELGLVPVPPERIAHLSPDGTLLMPQPTPTPAPTAARPLRARRPR